MNEESHGEKTGLLSGLLERMRNNVAASSIYDGASILDVGCGRAALLKTLYGQGKKRIEYWGIDVRQALVESLRAEYPEHRFIAADVTASSAWMPRRDFDVIAMIALIEHLPEPRSVGMLLARHLAPGGRIVLTTPKKGFERLHRAGALLGFCSKEAAEEHVDDFFDRDSLGSLARGIGLQLEEYRSFLFGLNQFAIFSRTGG